MNGANVKIIRTCFVEVAHVAILKNHVQRFTDMLSKRQARVQKHGRIKKR